MKIAIRHQLSLAVGVGAARAVQHVLLTPLSGPTQTVREWSIDMPGMEGAASFLDGFGNRARLVTQVKPDAELLVTASGVVETTDRNGVLGRLPGEPPPALFRRPTALTKPIGAITSKFRSTPRDGQSRIALLHALMSRVGEVLDGGEQSQSQDGVSQSQSQAERPPSADFAHAFIGAARALDIPARFVSGYVADTDDAPAYDSWAEAWDDGLGWIAFDPTRGVCPTDRHVRVATGLDALSTVPVRSIPAIGTAQVLAMRIEAAQ